MKIEQIENLSNDWAERFPKRLTHKQKERFLSNLENELKTRTFETERITLRHWGIPNHLLLTQCESPRVIFLAHFDTPTIMPPGIGAVYRLFGHTRQGISSLVVIVLLQVMYIGYFWLASLTTNFWATIYLLGLGVLFLFPFFFPNPHNREDNTSGVLGLLAIADWAKDKPEIRRQIQFAFLDNEEWGLIGSRALKHLWQKQKHLYGTTQVINLDCISRGQNPLVVYHKNEDLAQEVLPFLQHHIPQTQKFDMKNTPLSDNFTFRELGSIDISLADPSLIPGGYFIPRVHTPKDDDFTPRHMLALVEGLTDFLANQLKGEA